MIDFFSMSFGQEIAIGIGKMAICVNIDATDFNISDVIDFRIS